jgi:hypothetical protein
MSVNGVFLAPTPLEGDAFALRRATVSTAGEAYLHIGDPKSTALETFGSELERWTAKTSHAEIASASSGLIAWLSGEIRTLANARVPKAGGSLVRLLIDKLDAMIERVRTPALMSPTALTLWKSALIHASDEAHYVAHLLLRALGLPELPYSPRVE